MRVSTAIIAAALGPTAIRCTASGFAKSCTNVALTNPKGEPGRSMMLQAYCEPYPGAEVYPFTELDLNTCFGWNAEWSRFEPPAASHFTDRCANCSHNPAGDERHPDHIVYCHCARFGQNDIGLIINLSKLVLILFLAPFFSNGRDPFSLLTRAWQMIILETLGGS